MKRVFTFMRSWLLLLLFACGSCQDIKAGFFDSWWPFNTREILGFIAFKSTMDSLHNQIQGLKRTITETTSSTLNTINEKTREALEKIAEFKTSITKLKTTIENNKNEYQRKQSELLTKIDAMRTWSEEHNKQLQNYLGDIKTQFAEKLQNNADAYQVGFDVLHQKLEKEQQDNIARDKDYAERLKNLKKEAQAQQSTIGKQLSQIEQGHKQLTNEQQKNNEFVSQTLIKARDKVLEKQKASETRQQQILVGLQKLRGQLDPMNSRVQKLSKNMDALACDINDLHGGVQQVYNKLHGQELHQKKHVLSSAAMLNSVLEKMPESCDVE